jgi:hypothetical protein
MSDATATLCRKYGKEAKLLPAGTYKQDDSTWVACDNAERRGYECSNPTCAQVFGTSVAKLHADPKFGLKSTDEALE